MSVSTEIKGNKKIIRSWAFYDWANSVYNLVITATIFPIYYSSVTPAEIEFFGTSMKNTTLYDFSISFGYLIIVILAPFLSGIADYGGYKKRFMQFFCYMGAIACSCLYFFTEETVMLGITLAIIACIGYSGSLVFYNAFLPEIAHPEDQDRISAKGFSMGYIGSSILLILNLVMVMKPELFGFENTGQATRFAFLTVGVWWLLFAQIPFYQQTDSKN
jgi:MFS transporter, UMF1 family